MGTYDKNLNVVPSEAAFSAVSGHKISDFTLLGDFIHKGFNVKKLYLVLRENMVLLNTLEIKPNVKQRIKWTKFCLTV